MAALAAVPPEQMQPVTSLCVKSVIATPLDGAQVVTGKLLTIRGVAWAGDAGPVTAVEVSVDNGRAAIAPRVEPFRIFVERRSARGR